MTKNNDAAAVEATYDYVVRGHFKEENSALHIL